MKFVVLEDNVKNVKQLGLVNWQILYLRFKDESGESLQDLTWEIWGAMVLKEPRDPVYSCSCVES